MTVDIKTKLNATVAAAGKLIKQSDRMKRIKSDIEKREKEEIAIQSAMVNGSTAPDE